MKHVSLVASRCAGVIGFGGCFFARKGSGGIPLPLASGAAPCFQLFPAERKWAADTLLEYFRAPLRIVAAGLEGSAQSQHHGAIGPAKLPISDRGNSCSRRPLASYPSSKEVHWRPLHLYRLSGTCRKPALRHNGSRINQNRCTVQLLRSKRSRIGRYPGI